MNGYCRAHENDINLLKKFFNQLSESKVSNFLCILFLRVCFKFGLGLFGLMFLFCR